MPKFKAPFYIGADFGTQGVRTGIIDSCGNILSQKEYFYNTIYPNIGWAEQNPNDWWHAFIESLRESLAEISESDKTKIMACSVCATASTVIPVSFEGKALSNALIWMDSRAYNEAVFINQTNHPILKFCGGEVSPEWLVPKALWIKKNNPKIYDSSYKIVEQLDWINFKLCGNWVSSVNTATIKQNYFDIEGGWNDDYYKKIGFEDYKDKLILDVKKVGEPIGTLSKKFTEAMGISSNIVLVEGSTDAYAAVLGLGVTKSGRVGSIMGTSFVHMALSKDPVFIKGIWGPYHNALSPNYWMLEAGQISAGSIINWFKDVFDIKADNPYDFLSDEASKVPIGSEGLITLDYFQGNRSPYKNSKAKGVFYGLSLKHTRAHMYRSVLESISFGTKNIIDNYVNQGCNIESMVVCGGVTKDPTWLQIIADVTGKPIIITENAQAGVLGCCVTAAVGYQDHSDFEQISKEMVREKKRIEPNISNNKQYSEIYSSYLDIYQSLKHLMR
jgi:FGGY-family pentulose kinase